VNDQVGGEHPVREEAAHQSGGQELASRERAEVVAYGGGRMLVRRATVLFDRSPKHGDVDNGRVASLGPWPCMLAVEKLGEASLLTESSALAFGERGIDEYELRADRLGLQDGTRS